MAPILGAPRPGRCFARGRATPPVHNRTCTRLDVTVSLMTVFFFDDLIRELFDAEVPVDSDLHGCERLLSDERLRCREYRHWPKDRSLQAAGFSRRCRGSRLDGRP